MYKVLSVLLSVAVTDCVLCIIGNLGHFFVYAPANAVDARNYGVARYGMEVQRLCAVLEMHFSEGAQKGGSPRTYLVNEEYTVADMCVLPWALQLRDGYPHSPSGIKAGEFLSVRSKYPLLMAWIDRISARPAVQRGLVVCPFQGDNTKPWTSLSSTTATVKEA